MHLYHDSNLSMGLTGGIILGLSSSMYMLLTGEISGMSGFIENSLTLPNGTGSLSYLAGLTLSGYVMNSIDPSKFGSVNGSIPLEAVIISGFLVGLGTRLGSGYTSGHGLCGLARSSKRSFAAVITFMSCGAISSYISRHTSFNVFIVPSLPFIHPAWPVITRASLISFFAYQYVRKIGSSATSMLNHVLNLCSSFVSGVGLSLSGMCNPERVLMFLDFSGGKGWDPTLCGVMGGGVIVNAIAFNALKNSKLSPLCANKDSPFSSRIKIGDVPENRLITWRLILGSALFGAAWGLVGICPGPAIVSLGASVEAATAFVPAMMVGMKFSKLI